MTNMSKYIDAEKLKERISRLRDEFIKKSETKGYTTLEYLHKAEGLSLALQHITSLQQEQPMPDSTKLIELWHKDKEMLKEKDFRDDPWRLAYNAFMCGFGRGITVNKQKEPEVDLEEEIKKYCRDYYNCNYPDQIQNDRCSPVMPHIVEAARHFYELGRFSNK